MDRVLQRRDTAANWSTTNPILAEGEIGIITDGAKGYKIGDGVTRWNALEYPANPTSVVGELGDSEVAVINQQTVTNYVNSLCVAAGEIEQHIQSVSYNNVQIQWKKSQIVLDLGGYTGNLLLSPVTPFDDSNYVIVNNSNLPFTLAEDYKSLRSTVDIDNTIKLKGSLFGDVENLDNEITELENITGNQLNVPVNTAPYTSANIPFNEGDVITSFGTYTGNIILSITDPFDSSTSINITPQDLPFKVNTNTVLLRTNIAANTTLTVYTKILGKAISTEDELQEISDIVGYSYSTNLKTSTAYSTMNVKWQKGYTITSFGSYNGSLLLSETTPFDTTNYVTINPQSLPYTLLTDILTVRSTSSIDTAIQLSIGLQRDVEVLKQYQLQNGKPQYMQNKGDMTDGTLLQLNRNSVSTFNTITFSANIVSFTKLLIGHGREAEAIYRASWLEIDDTNVVVCRYESADSIKKTTLAHGLTVSNTIQLELNTEKSGLNLRFTSNGVMFEQTVSSSNWGGSSGTVFVQSEGSVLDNAVLGWSAKTINSHIWAFGDSYFVIDPTRWPYYLLNNGYQDILLNAYGGQKSIQALSDLQVLLNNGTPKYILWCMGMNDADSSTEVNSSWLSTYESVKEICSKNNIELILSTIPTVSGNGSIRINKYKNSIVKSSGFRYIDFDSAVGADETTGEWYTGMLSSDGVHPSVQGAITLYNKAISDFPELVSLKTLSL